MAMARKFVTFFERARKAGLSLITLGLVGRLYNRNRKSGDDEEIDYSNVVLSFTISMVEEFDIHELKIYFDLIKKSRSNFKRICF